MASIEERVAALEVDLAKARADFQEAVGLMQFLGGSERVFQGAVLAMIQMHPDKAALRPVLEQAIERAFVAVHYNAQDERHAQGAEGARGLILEFLNTP